MSISHKIFLGGLASELTNQIDQERCVRLIPLVVQICHVMLCNLVRLLVSEQTHEYEVHFIVAYPCQTDIAKAALMV